MCERRIETIVVLNAKMTENYPQSVCDLLTVGDLLDALSVLDRDIPIYVGNVYRGDYWRVYGPVRGDDVFEVEHDLDTDEVTVVGNL